MFTHHSQQYIALFDLLAIPKRDTYFHLLPRDLIKYYIYKYLEQDDGYIDNRYGDMRYYNSKNELHRLDGPAKNYHEYHREYYINGVQYSEEQWKIERRKYVNYSIIDSFKEWYCKNEENMLITILIGLICSLIYKLIIVFR